MAGPSVQSTIRQGLRYYSQNITLEGFDGGLNLRDTITEMGPKESPDCWNVTFDERGGVGSRLGFTKWNAAAAGNLLTQGYYSKVAGKVLWYSKADGKLYSDPGSGVFTLARTWTSGYRLGIVDFAGLVYAIHPTQGLYSSADGVTWAAVVATAGSTPVGDLLVNWQNRLISAGDPAHANRLTACHPGTATNWDTTAPNLGWTNDVREKDDSPIVAMHGGAGFDQQTKPALLVFKSESVYRVTDSSTGSYITLDSKVGTCSAKSIVSLYGNVYSLSRRGVYKTDGFSPMIPVGEQILPQFTAAAMNFAQLELVTAGWSGDRVYFSIPRAGSSANDLCLEYHPLVGWYSANSNAMGCYVAYGDTSEILLGASPTVTGQTYRMNNGGTDDAAAIVSRYVTRAFAPNAAYQSKMQMIRAIYRGDFTAGVFADAATTANSTNIFSTSTTTGFAWGVGQWGIGQWGHPVSQRFTTWWPRVVGREYQIRVDATTTTTAALPALLETGIAPTVGAWALYGMTINLTPLGLS